MIDFEKLEDERTKEIIVLAFTLKGLEENRANLALAREDFRHVSYLNEMYDEALHNLEMESTYLYNNLKTEIKNRASELGEVYKIITLIHSLKKED